MLVLHNTAGPFFNQFKKRPIEKTQLRQLVNAIANGTVKMGSDY